MTEIVRRVQSWKDSTYQECRGIWEEVRDDIVPSDHPEQSAAFDRDAEQIAILSRHDMRWRAGLDVASIVLGIVATYAIALFLSPGSGALLVAHGIAVIEGAVMLPALGLPRLISSIMGHQPMRGGDRPRIAALSLIASASTLTAIGWILLPKVSRQSFPLGAHETLHPWPGLSVGLGWMLLFGAQAALALAMLLMVISGAGSLMRWRRETTDPVIGATAPLVHAFYLLGTLNPLGFDRSKVLLIEEVDRASRNIAVALPWGLKMDRPEDRAELLRRCRGAAAFLHTLGPAFATPMHDTIDYARAQIRDMLRALISREYDTLPFREPASAQRAVARVMVRVRSVAVAAIPVTVLAGLQAMGWYPGGTFTDVTILTCALYASSSLMTAIDPNFTTRLATVKNLAGLLADGAKNFVRKSDTPVKESGGA